LEFIGQAIAAQDRISYPKRDNFGGAPPARVTLARKRPWRSSISHSAGSCCFSAIIDGDEIEIHADVLIQATCFRPMHEAIAQTVSLEIADRDGCP
jgi:hypothetical protein